MRNVTTKVLIRWTRKTLAVGFATWREQEKDKRRAKNVVQKVAARWRLKGISSALARWIESVAETLRLRKVLDGVIRRWTQQTLSAALFKWQNRSKGQKRQEQVLEKTLRRMINITMSVAYGTWKTNYKEIKRLKKTTTKILMDRILKPILMRMRNGFLARAYLEWRSQVELLSKQREEARLHNILNKTASTWRRKLDLSQAFEGLLLHRHEQKRTRHLGKKNRWTFM